MKILVDTNIILDIALNRKPFVTHAALIWRLAEQKVLTACLSNTSITDIFYIISKHTDKNTAKAFIADILDTFTLVDIDEMGFRKALESDINDFEDAVQYVIGEHNHCHYLVTRNIRDFPNKPNIVDPEQFIQVITTLL